MQMIRHPMTRKIARFVVISGGIKAVLFAGAYLFTQNAQQALVALM